MSDFDEEAERERLREKYERDQKKREATERMSDLLLKGATMTNAHCEQCGDPIFRYDGQEFCPTCEEVITQEPGDAAATDENGAATTGDAEGATGEDVADRDATAAESEETTGAATSADAGESESQSGTDDETTPSHIEIKSPAGSPAEGDADGSGSTGESGATGSGAADADAASVDAGTAGRDGSTAGPAAGGSTPGAGVAGGSAAPPSGASVPESGSGDLTAARESLVRTLVAQARRAEDCEDPRRARDHLAAAREAAEALAALSY